jgi:hypothetical protein
MIDNSEKLENLRNQLFGDSAERECREVVIDYLLEKHSTETNKPNSILQLEGRIRYYEEVKRKYYDALSETSYRLTSRKNDNLGDVDQANFQASGQGPEGFHLEKYKQKVVDDHQSELENSGKRITDLIFLCDEKIAQLKAQIDQEQE